MSNKAIFTLLLIIHVVTAVALGLYVYSPSAHDSDTFAVITKAVVFPLVAISGATMYIYPRMKRAAKDRTGS